MNDSLSNAERIWQALAAIPSGSVVSYGQLAELAGLPGCARLVGHTLKKLPEGTRLPWHRVINAAGRISFEVGSPRFVEQKQRLLAEGVEFHNNRINLNRHRWNP
ncbi:MGMT family protein [Motiliproteus sp.]|uniref:MGMT family protein n=1 Tax=Motiliproteus sp. TaxID=1898955 RepID=UPI003BAB9E8A